MAKRKRITMLVTVSVPMSISARAARGEVRTVLKDQKNCYAEPYRFTVVSALPPPSEITVFVVTTCIPDRGEAPCMPDVFGTEADAVAFLEKMLSNEWDSHGTEDEETGERLPYPGNWEEAQEQILSGFTDGSWGQWQLTSHTVKIGKEN